jgi:tellurite resistance protein/uncharacterized protein (DUF697 family)
MSEAEHRATLTIAVMAAFADGMNDDRERSAVERIAADLGGGFDAAAIREEVQSRRLDLSQVAEPLVTRQSRQAAYELAVGVAQADGATSPREGEFLAQLASALGLPAPAAQGYVQSANAIAMTAVTGTAPSSSTSAKPDAAALEQLIVNAAITNAALELLPETLASMAIIPLQMKLVYRIGQAYGHELDGNSLKDFLATLGVGLTAQYLEQYGRKLLGGLLGTIAGGIGRAIGHQAARGRWGKSPCSITRQAVRSMPTNCAPLSVHS